VRLAFRDLIGSNELEAFANGAIKIDKVLLDAVAGLNKIEDPAKKAALAGEIFGRDWRDALQVMGSWKGEVGEGPITPEMAQQAGEFNTSLREVKSELERVFVILAADLLPTLQQAADWFKQVADRAAG